MIQISTRQVSCQIDAPRYYQVATETIACDRLLPIARGFEVNAPETSGLRWSLAEIPIEAKRTAVFDRSGWISGAWRHVRAMATEAGYHIWIEGIGTFDVLESGGFIRFRDPLTELSNSCWIEALFGPAMMLALALNEVWVLHASAASFAGKTIAFLGESGAGKSTLARTLGMQPGWQRVADDILPVKRSGETISALPHFPQFKLPQSNQPGITMSAQMPLHAIYILEKPQNQLGSRLGEGVRIRPLSGQRAMSSLVGHTVGARLFGRDLLGGHLSFSQNTASTIPIHFLNFPRGHEWMMAVREALEQHSSHME